MAVNDPKFSEGESVLIKSSGTTVTHYFSEGKSLILHEYVAAAAGRPLPARIFSGPFSGSLGGVI